ncbi:hypothetical protein [Candidatus Electronema sp. JC]|uniref:hypothetical protein n=1 Tax=Candidatus Electronema sp. JC TaxID=3401570 RepID=UPI003B43039B
MRETRNGMFALFACLFYSIIFLSSASDVRAEKDFSVYIWEFGTREGQKTETTRNVTQEFEGAFIRTQCCSVLERRNYDLLMSQRENEQAIMSMEGIADASVNTLKTLEADAVVFGEVYDDVQSGEVKIIVAVQNFAGKSLTSQSVRFSRGKLSDAASREESMKALAEKVCSALVEKKIVQRKFLPVNYSFSSYNEGEIVPELGNDNMIVKTARGLALTGASSSPAMIIVSGFSYKNSVELIVKIDTNGEPATEKISLWSGTKEFISIDFGASGTELGRYYTLTFGDYTKSSKDIDYKGDDFPNELKITISNGIARFYLNGSFIALQKVNINTVDKASVSGIKRGEDFIYSVSVTPLD